jgi:hypothetical protein
MSAAALSLLTRIVAGRAQRLDGHDARAWPDSIPDRADAGCGAVARMLWAAGGWLSQPGRAAIAGADPASPASRGAPPQPGAYDQRAIAALSLRQSRARRDAATRGRVIARLTACGAPPAAWRHNRALFRVSHCASRATPGAPPRPHSHRVGADRDPVAAAAWYDDRWRGCATHELAWIGTGGASDPARADWMRRRIRERLVALPAWFAADGADATTCVQSIVIMSCHCHTSTGWRRRAGRPAWHTPACWRAGMRRRAPRRSPASPAPPMTP